MTVAGDVPFHAMSPQRIVAIIGAAVLALGSLLDWATVSIGFGEIGVAGTEGDGKITLIAGIVAMILLLTGQPQIGAPIAIVGAVVALYDWWHINSKFAESGGTAQVGIGLYLCIAGGAAAGIAGLLPEQKPAPAVSNIGWFPDPFHRHVQRYFDGTQWTEHVFDNGVAGIDPPTS